MKADKKQKRVKQRAKKVNLQRDQSRRAEANNRNRLIAQQLEVIEAKSKPNKAQEEKYSVRVFRAVNIAYSFDSFTPSLIGIILGIHFSRVNLIIEDIGWQGSKIKGSIREVTEEGMQYLAEKTNSGLKWKSSVIDILSSRYGFDVDQNLKSGWYRTNAILAAKSIN